MTKSTVDQIRERFDKDVERFSNLETGQSATVDAPFVLDLITAAAGAVNPDATHSLDIGCGAGNYTLKLLQKIPNLSVTLVDLSLPMLERASQRITPCTRGSVTTLQADIRHLELEQARFDVIMAAAVFHHLRSDDEWRSVFRKCFLALKPGGSMWISDLIEHDHPQIQSLMKQKYGEYLTSFRDEAYRELVFSYIEQEDTPRSLNFQIKMLQEAGFEHIEILHKNNCFAAFGAIK